jgi:putative transposase
MLGFLDLEDPMKGKRVKEEQIIRILQETEAGIALADLCRKHDCSEQSFYLWKVKHGGIEVLDPKRRDADAT